MEKFKAELVAALGRCGSQTKENSFIGQLGPFQIPDVESTQLPASEIILERLERIERRIPSASAWAMSKTRSLREDFQHPARQPKIIETKTGGFVFIFDVSDAVRVDNGASAFLEKFPFYHEKITISHVNDSVRVEVENAGLKRKFPISDFLVSIQEAIPF